MNAVFQSHCFALYGIYDYLCKKNVSRKQKKTVVYEKVRITDVAAEGKSLARIGDKVVFTTHVVPGDVVDLQVIRSRKRYEEARVVQFHQYSEERAVPFCSHFGLCGGCTWQNLPYALQLKYKRKQVVEQLERIGKLEMPEVLPALGSHHTIFYRNKLEYTFSNNRWLTGEEISSQISPEDRNVLGYHVPGRFDKVFRVEKCWLQQEPSDTIRNFLFKYAASHDYPFFDLREQKGFLRTLIIRTSTTGEVMVVLTFFSDDRIRREAVLGALKEQFPEITSIQYAINNKGNDTLLDQEIVLFYGSQYITEVMEGLRFSIGPKSFYQTNSLQSVELYRKVKEFATLSGDETLYDLYTGTGTIANYLAGSCKKVIGIEYVPEAIEDAAINSEINRITNTRFFAGDIRKIMTREFISLHGSPDVIITDPPRSGMHEEVVQSITDAAPLRIVYVSCNPATQARDLALMKQLYTVEKVQPVDMFPHTHHVENIVLLTRKRQGDFG